MPLSAFFMNKADINFTTNCFNSIIKSNSLLVEGNLTLFNILYRPVDNYISVTYIKNNALVTLP